MLFLRQLGWELFRLFARRRTYIGFGVFLAVEMLIYWVMSMEGARKSTERFIERLAGGFDDYYSALTIAFMIFSATMFILGAIFVSLVAGDILAKETEDGNLRLLLARPISRLRIIVVKFVSCQIYTLVLFLFVGTSAFIVGLFERGWGGGMIVWSPQLPAVPIFDWNTGLQRYFLSIFAFAVIYIPVSGMAFMFGCFRIKPATATIVTVAVIFADWILHSIPLPAFDPYREYFITSRMSAWLLLLHQEIPWARFAEAAVWLVGFGLTGFLVGWIAFERRDVKS